MIEAIIPYAKADPNRETDPGRLRNRSLGRVINRRPWRLAAVLAAALLSCACGRREPAPAPERVVYVVVTPSPAPTTAAEALAAAMTALPRPTPTDAPQSAEQSFVIPTAAPQEATPPAAPVALDRVEPTPVTIQSELERCLSYLVVDDTVHRAVLLPGQMPLLVTARNTCDLTFQPGDSWFEVRAVDRTGQTIARDTGHFIVPIPAKGSASVEIILYPIPDDIRMQVTYKAKPWWAAGGGRRIGE